jgi:uncharacterized protein YodC (DUF2158 family)
MPQGFEVGQVVRLKSGGPLMTIKGIDVYGNVPHIQAKCEWFDKGHKREEGVFELPTLECADQERPYTSSIGE